MPRLLPELADGTEGPLHRVIDGTLVFADLSGFTALSERLAQSAGKAGAEEMTVVLNAVFGELLDLASARGGEMLKYGGDALLLLFRGNDHAAHAVAAAREMQRGLVSVGNIATEAGRVRLRMSVGVHSGPIDFFVVGPHRELVVAGPVPSHTAAMETAADAGEILISADTAALLRPYCVGAAKGDGFLLKQSPRRLAPVGHTPRSDGDLSDYIPVGLRETLLAGPVQPEHRPVAIGFFYLDMHDELDLNALDATFSGLLEIFERFGVTLMATDLAGGGVKVIAAAGLPVAQPDAEERMLRAAREAASAGLALPLRVGIQRGHVFAGTVGPSYRMTFTVIGDVVNTAARLMAKAEPGEVLTLMPVLEYASTEFAVEELAPFTAKGKAEPLIPLRVGEALRRRRRTDEVLPLVGRDKQMALLDDGIEVVRQGGGGSIEVIGDAGMGKSRLVDEVVAHLDDVAVVRAECNELDQTRPYFVAEVVLRQLSGASSLDELRATVEDAEPELLEWLPLLALAHGFDCAPTPATEHLTPGAVPGKVREVTVALLHAVVTAPTLVVVEDLHWADAPSQRLLSVFSASEAPLMLLVTRRPVDLVAAFGDRASFTLDELPADAAGQMLDRLVGRPLLPDQRAAVLARAAGNPLFLRELAVALASGDDELPDRLESLIEARIDRLGTADRYVIRAAAVVGQDFSEAELAAALEAPVAPTTWDRLAAFVAPDDTSGRYRFRHALMRDSAYAGLPYRWRRTIHARVGGFIEAQPDADSQVERLAVHFGVAKDKTRAWRYGTAAGDRARARFAFAEAAAFYSTALSYADTEADHEERFRVVDSNAYCLQTFGNLAGALDAIRRGGRLVRGHDEQRARLLLQEATVLRNLGEIDDADKILRAGLRLTKLATDASVLRTRSRMLTTRSTVEVARARLEPAHALVLDAAEVSKSIDDAAGLAHALATRYDIELALRSPGRDEVGEQAHALYSELGQPADAAFVLNLMGTDRQYSGDFAGAVEAYVEAERAQRAAGLTLHAAVSGHNRAYLLTQQGRYTEAGEIARELVGTFAAAGYAAGRDAAICIAAEAAAMQGDGSRLNEVEDLVADARASDRDNDAAEYALVLSESWLVLGQPERSQTHLPEPEALAAPDMRMRAERLKAVLRHLRTGAIESVTSDLDELAMRSIELELPREAALMRLMRAAIAGDDVAAPLRDLDAFGVVRVPLYDYLASLKSA